MPELPEVETVRRGLDALLTGQTVNAIHALEPTSLRGDTRELIGRRVIGSWRRGKVLGLELDRGSCLVAHLKMTGQMVYRQPATAGRDGGPDQAWGAGHPSDSLIGQLPDNSTRVILEFNDGGRLYFNDQRKFGWLAIMASEDVASIPLLARMGPEPFDPDAWPEFRRRIRRHQRLVIKATLLDQSVIAGIGNIYADEALWAARIHPMTPVGAVSDRKLKELLGAAVAVMELSLSLGGSTDRNYVDAEGRRGAYLDFAKVFRRQGQPCERCGRTIIKTRVAGRGTHICTNCQRRRALPAPSQPPGDRNSCARTSPTESGQTGESQERGTHQPRSHQPSKEGRSAPKVVGSPWPGWTIAASS
ncbi:MAG: bifunctional DNA-formamidopyrimidine glycosylase/DNA-(apurinic or apyrimidinic site) lyase [Bifidobacteriaceae bacterium]|nr:bifunctional DNA-formamidopyrimidine glycosylase/DNA-(apurinic or apyrimidinic site) lyase [Bifidobacteriaceae bacterium]